MIKIKKGLACLLSTVMVLGLAACGNNKSTADTGKTDADTKETTETTETADNGETKKLVFWDKSEYVAAYNELMKAKVEAFAKENNVEVDYVIVPSGDLKQKLAAAIESGNQPDLIMGDNTSVAEYVSTNQLADVSDVVDKIDYKDNAKAYTVFDGKDYLVPVSLTAPGMYMRNDKWGTMPTTWDELKEEAKKINDPENGFYALGLPLGASGGGDAESFLRTIILDFGGILVD
ncbi:MAG: extracellular solute-binding protein, partial [Lachnospiraceae bacterium]|nr:extracellular solute-binding protein [Lachnospiraceae bacterium]